MRTGPICPCLRSEAGHACHGLLDRPAKCKCLDVDVLWFVLRQKKLTASFPHLPDEPRVQHFACLALSNFAHDDANKALPLTMLSWRNAQQRNARRNAQRNEAAWAFLKFSGRNRPGRWQQEDHLLNAKAPFSPVTCIGPWTRAWDFLCAMLTGLLPFWGNAVYAQNHALVDLNLFHCDMRKQLESGLFPRYRP